MTTDAVVAEELTGPELVGSVPVREVRVEAFRGTSARSTYSTSTRSLDCVRRRASTDDRTWRLGSRDRASINARPAIATSPNFIPFTSGPSATGLLPTDPTVGIERRQHKPAPPRAISVEDLAAAVDAADPKMRAWLLLASGAGCTVQEIAALTPSDVLDRQTSSPSLRIRAGKGGRTRALFLFAQTSLRRSMRPLPTGQTVG